MAINQASFFLYPPRFAPEVEYEHEANTASGAPLAMIGSQIVDQNAPRVLNADVHAWFLRRGFREKENYSGMTVIFLDREKTFLSKQEVIETSIMLDEEEFEELYIRFLLTESTPDRIHQWEALIHEIGHDFDLKIMDPDNHSLLPCIDFYTLLLRNSNFAMFRKGMKWHLDQQGYQDGGGQPATRPESK